ncbi:hypothetical protein C8J57DRAFT_1341390, partial [Mycena rebaudengoi]
FAPTNRYIFFFVGSLATVFHSHFRNTTGGGVQGQEEHIFPLFEETFEPQNYGHNFDILEDVQLEQMDIEFDLDSDSYSTYESDIGPSDTSDMGEYGSQWDQPQYFPAPHKLDFPPRPTLRPPPQFPGPPRPQTSRMARHNDSAKTRAEAGAPPRTDTRFPTKSFPFAVPIATPLLRLRRATSAPLTQNGEISSSHAVSLDPLQDPLQPQRSVALAKSHSGVANSEAVYSSGLPTTQRPIPLSIPATTIYSDSILVYPRNNGQGIGKGRAVEDVPLPQTSTAVATTRPSVQSTFSNVLAPPRSTLANPPPVQAAASSVATIRPFVQSTFSNIPAPPRSTLADPLPVQAAGSSVATTRPSVQSTFSNIPAPPRSTLADPPPIQAAGSSSDLDVARFSVWRHAHAHYPSSAAHRMLSLVSAVPRDEFYWVLEQMQNQRRDFVFDHDIQMLP